MISTTHSSTIISSTSAVGTTTTSSVRSNASIQSGDVIFLATRSGTSSMVDVEGTTVQARWVSRGMLQALVIEKESGGPISSGDVVYLRSQADKHIEVEGEAV